jgi:hypothetical protein
MIATMDKRRLILLFLASAIFSLMVFFTIYALFMKDMDMGFVREPDVAPSIEVNTQANPETQEDFLDSDLGPALPIQEQSSGANSANATATTEKTEGVTDPATAKTNNKTGMSTDTLNSPKTTTKTGDSTSKTPSTTGTVKPAKVVTPTSSPSATSVKTVSRPAPVAPKAPTPSVSKPLAPPVPDSEPLSPPVPSVE